MNLQGLIAHDKSQPATGSVHTPSTYPYLPQNQQKFMPPNSLMFQELMKKGEFGYGIPMRSFYNPMSSMPMMPRADYSSSVTDRDQRHSVFEGRHFMPPPFFSHPYHGHHMPSFDMMSHFHNPAALGSIFHDQQRLGNTFLNRNYGVAPHATSEPKKKKEVQIITISDDEDEPKKTKPLEPKPSLGVIIPEKRMPVIEPKPQINPTAEGPLKRTRSTKEKIQAKKNPLNIKHDLPSSSTVQKKPGRPPITKPFNIDEENAANRNLKIKIKKIRKTQKPLLEQNKDRPVRERRAAQNRDSRPHDSPGKIRSGNNFQAQISEYVANTKKYNLEKIQRQQSLETRLKWNSKQNYAMYNELREKNPEVSASKIINFLVESKTDTSEPAFKSYLENLRTATATPCEEQCHNLSEQPNLSCTPMADLNQLSGDRRVLTRGTIRMKTVF